MSHLAQLLVLGILSGAVYSAVGSGFGLVWGVLNIVNLAHGALVIVGAYLTWLLFSSYRIDPFLTLPLDAALLFVIGYGLQRVLINRVIRAPLLFTFMLTFGINLIVINVLCGCTTVEAMLVSRRSVARGRSPRSARRVRAHARASFRRRCARPRSATARRAARLSPRRRAIGRASRPA